MIPESNKYQLKNGRLQLQLPLSFENNLELKYVTSSDVLGYVITNDTDILTASGGKFRRPTFRTGKI